MYIFIAYWAAGVFIDHGFAAPVGEATDYSSTLPMVEGQSNQAILPTFSCDPPLVGH
jgi:hypothetical protein